MYKVQRFHKKVGFLVRDDQILEAAESANRILKDLPASLYRCIDFKTISSIVGAIYCERLAEITGCIVNPIEKGHPDLVPKSAERASEASLRNYPEGLEVKCTIGNVTQGANLKAGMKRIKKLTSITWQAHHQEVRELMGLTWDFCQESSSFNHPGITGVFYTANLKEEDWGTVSGTTGRNTKVSGMKASGKTKMGEGWILLLDSSDYLDAFERLLGSTYS